MQVVEPPAVVPFSRVEFPLTFPGLEPRALDRAHQETQLDPPAPERCQIHLALNPGARPEITGVARQRKGRGVTDVADLELVFGGAETAVGELGETGRRRSKPPIGIGRIEEVVLGVAVVDRIEKAVGEIDGGLRVIPTATGASRRSSTTVRSGRRNTDGLPLPLGLDLVRRDLGRELAGQISDTLRRSIAAALANEADALEYALQYGRGISPEVNEKFVKMYVNEDTLDMGEPGLKALRHLYRRAREKGLLDEIPEIDLV